MSELVVLDALCPGDTDGRLCNGDLSKIIMAACDGKTMSTIAVRCPGCHRQVTVWLSWRELPVCMGPTMLAE